MKYLKGYYDSIAYSEIENACNKYKIIYWSINNGLVDVDGNVDLVYKNLDALPVSFGKVSGNFHCPGNNLTSLKGAPYIVEGLFNCYTNKLNTLEHCPKYMSGLNFAANDVYTVDIPKDIKFYCPDNPVFIIYQYVAQTEDFWMFLKIELDYFIDSKILIGKDIYINRFIEFLDINGLNSNIDSEKFIDLGYNVIQ